MVMRKMKRLLALGLAGMMVLSATGCKSTDKTKDSVAGTTQAAATGGTSTGGTTAAASSDGEDVTLKFTWWGGQTRHELTQQLLDKYTELHPNVKFEAVPSGWDGYFDKLATQAAAGAMPDIVQMDYLYISTYAKNSSIADLTPYIEDGTIDTSSIDENLMKSGEIGGKTVGLVYSSSLLAMGYNPLVLEEAGVAVPSMDWTWSDFIDLCKTVKDKTGKLGSATGPVDDTNLFNYWVRQHGASLFSDDQKSLGYDDDQVCIDYLNMWSELMAAGAVPNPDEYAAIQTLGQEAGPVVTGEGATMIEWNNYANKVASVNDKLKITSLPLSDNTEYKGLWNKPGMFLTISETSAHKKEAAEFINWFVNSEEANDIMMGERGTPASSAVREHMKSTGKLSPQQEEMFNYLDITADICGETPAPDPIGMSEINEAFKNAAYSAFYGQVSAEEAAKTFREEANAILVRNN